MAVVTTAAWTRSPANAAANAAGQRWGGAPSTRPAPRPRWSSRPNTVAATAVSNQNEDRLTASLIGAWRRYAVSATNDPVIRAATTANGPRMTSPTTSGTALNDTACTSRRCSKVNRKTSVAKNAAATSSQMV